VGGVTIPTALAVIKRVTHSFSSLSVEVYTVLSPHGANYFPLFGTKIDGRFIDIKYSMRILR
jgi:hypothetical protein